MIKKVSAVIIMLLYCLPLSGSLDPRLSSFIDSLEASGLYREAITEYRRYLFFNDLNEEESGKIWLKMAVCFREMNLESEMMEAFNQSFRYLSKSRSIEKLYEEISVFYLSRGKTEWARLYLSKLNEKKPSQRKIQYLILSHMMDENWREFFSLLPEAGYKKSVIDEIKEMVRQISKNNRTFNVLTSIDKIVPGIGLGFTGDFFTAGESLLFHSYVIQQIFVEPTVLGKLIFGFTLLRLYSRTTAYSRDTLMKKRQRKKLRLEKKIVEKLIRGSQL